MGKVQNPSCAYCGADREDAEHTFFKCDRWAILIVRSRLQTKTGHLTPDNVIKTMLETEERWEEISTYVEKILRQKKREVNLVAETP